MKFPRQLFMRSDVASSSSCCCYCCCLVFGIYLYLYSFFFVVLFVALNELIKRPYIMAENKNDIKLPFPLGSSTQVNLIFPSCYYFFFAVTLMLQHNKIKEEETKGRNKFFYFHIFPVSFTLPCRSFPF